MAIEVYPVVHVRSKAQALEQSSLAEELGCDGVYLIDHGSYEDDLLTPTYQVVKSELPNFFVGVNYLGKTSFQALRGLVKAKQKGDISRLPNGLWVDDAIPSRHEMRELRRWSLGARRVEYLGGVAFKYTRGQTQDPEFAAFQAESLAPFVGVVTTTGTGTGSSPSPEKIRAMKDAIGRKKLAIASGIDAENLAHYAGFVSKVLVSTSLETFPMSGEFVPEKVDELVRVAKELPSAYI